MHDKLRTDSNCLIPQTTEDAEYSQQLKFLLTQLEREDNLTPPASPPPSPHHLQVS